MIKVMENKVEIVW